MFAVTVRMRVEPGKFDAFMARMAENAAASLKLETECTRFDVWTDPNRPGEVFLYELYASPEAFDLHLASDHFKTFDADVADMLLEKTVATYREQA
ncbi:MAG: putative quinol monooxygenase [Pseudomonadota bacterium]